MHWLVREVVGRLTRRITRRWFAQFERATARCRETQQRVLLQKIRRNQTSDFGKSHHFDQIHSVTDLRRHLPVTDYKYFAPYIERVKCGETTAMFGPKTKVHMFAMTSGSTAEPKYIPVTDEFLSEYRYGWMLWGIRAYDSHSDIYRLKVLQLASHWRVSETSGGIPCGAISGLTASGQKRIVRERYCLPSCLMKVRDISAKYYAAIRYSITWPVGMVMAANPSTLIGLARFGNTEKERLLRDLANGTLTSDFEYPDDVREELASRTAERHPERVRELEQIIARTGNLYPKDYWPNLTVLANWTGGSMMPYLAQYRDSWGDLPVRDIGLIASEGRMTIPLEDNTPAGVLDILHQFYEFIPEAEIESEQPTVLEAHELREGQQYYILLTTSSGLYRYNIHDLVRCVGHFNGTPLLEFLNKGSQFSNVAGEKLSEHQVSSALSHCLREVGMRPSAITLAPSWADPPYYSVLAEERDVPNEKVAREFIRLLDGQLGAVNFEYQSKRVTKRLGPVRLNVVANGTWTEFARNRLAKGGNADQYKHPCLISKVDFGKELRVIREIDPESVPALRSA